MPSFEAISEAAVVQYTNQTGKDLNRHPLASSFNACCSVESVLAIFQEQALNKPKHLVNSEMAITN